MNTLTHIAFDEDNLFESLSTTAQINNRTGLKNPIFVTGIKRGVLFDAFMSGLKNDKERQEYNCSCCRNFINRYGNLAVIGDDGLPKSLLWDEGKVIPRFAKSFEAMRKIVESSEFARVFQSSESLFGVPEVGGFAHMSFDLVNVPNPTHNNGRKTPIQASLISLADYKHLKENIEWFSLETIAEVLALFENHVVMKQYPSFKDRVAKIHNIAKLLREHRDNRVRDNALWYTVAMETPDIIYFDNTVLGKLLAEFENVKHSGLAVKEQAHKEAIREFTDRTRPEVYMRPTEPPKQGNVVQAEKIVAERGLTPSFERRQATVDDLSNFYWKPQAQEAEQSEKTGLFKDIQVKNAKKEPKKSRIPGGTMTYVKFVRDVLPKAKSIKLVVPNHASGNWTALLTAVNPDSPPIFKWDKLEERNTVSSFVLLQPAPSHIWSMEAGAEAEVVGIIRHPRDFGKKLGEYGEQRPVLFLIKGAKLPVGSTPVCIFPEDLIPELYEVRSVVEAYSKKTMSIDHPEAVSGFSMHNGSPGFTIIVENETNEVVITLDRFE